MPSSSQASRRFEKAQRLRRRGEFQRVFDSGQRGRGRYFTIVMAGRQGHGPRLGIVASRKLGDSVRRNRAKRLIREIFRHSQPPAGTAGVDIVVIPRRELFDASYEHLADDYRTAVARCAARLSL